METSGKFKLALAGFMKGCSLGIGSAFLRLKAQKMEIKTKRILVNRSDRIGDAFVSLPLLLKLAKEYDVTVITSEYNEWALKPFFRTLPLKKSMSHPLAVLAPLRLIGGIFSSAIAGFGRKGAEYDLYFDMIGDLEMLPYGIRKSKCAIGPAKFFCVFYDEAVSMFQGNSKNILENYADLLRKVGVDGALGEADYKEAVSALDKVAGKGQDKVEKGCVLVNVGCKEHRNLTEDAWAAVLSGLSNYTETKGLKVMVMDDREKRLIGKLKGRLSGMGNLAFIDEEMDLWQSYLLAKDCLLYVGMDGGISHLLQLPANALVIFTFGDYNAWRPFAKGWDETLRDGKDVLETAKWAGLRKAIIYRIAERPPLDLGYRVPSCEPSPGFIEKGMEKLILELC